MAVSRVVDHIPNYRQEQVNVSAGVSYIASTSAAWGEQTKVQSMPLYEAHRAFVLGAPVMHADETPIGLFDPRMGKPTRLPTQLNNRIEKLLPIGGGLLACPGSVLGDAPRRSPLA